MIGEFIFTLRAENSTGLPFINGRFMHAAFFKILNEFSPAFGNFIHNELNLKPFTVSFLKPAENLPSSESRWLVRRGDKFFLRITGLNAEILQVVSSVPVGCKIQAGSLKLSVENISGENCLAVEELVARIKNSPPVKEIAFDFVSPVTFRIDNFDAPYPRAELIFASLADKWTQAAMPAAVDKKSIRDLATQIRLTEWQGQSRKFYFAHDRGTLAFSGEFFFNLEALSADIRKVFMLLARFGEFAGVGRLTGQGFGQVRTKFVT